jgi:chromosome segregation ATPase
MASQPGPIDDVERYIRKAVRERDELEAGLSAQCAHTAKIADKCAENKAALNSQDARMAQMLVKLSAAESDRDRLQSQLHELEKRHRVSEGERDAARTRVAELERQLLFTEKTLDVQESSLDRVGESRHKLKNDLASLAAKLTACETERDQMRGECEKMRAGVEQLAAKCKETELLAASSGRPWDRDSYGWMKDQLTSLLTPERLLSASPVGNGGGT